MPHRRLLFLTLLGAACQPSELQLEENLGYSSTWTASASYAWSAASAPTPPRSS